MAACSELLAYGPAQLYRPMLLASFDQGLRDRPGRAAMQAMGSLFTKYAPAKDAKDAPREIKFGPALTKQLLAGWKEDTTDATLLRLLVLADHQPARDRVRTLAFDGKVPLKVRVGMVAMLAPVDLERLLGNPESDDIRLAALDALANVDRKETPAAVLKHYPDMSPKLRLRTIDMLLARKSWALALLQSVDAGKLSSQDIAVEQLRIISVHDDKRLTALVRKHWGNVSAGTPEEKLAEMRRHNNDLNAGKGDPIAGKMIYKKLCANCHQLFGDGEKVGPDLTTANRRDRDFLLASIVDPSAVIRREYLSHIVTTTDGRTLTGLIVERTPGKLTLVNAKSERVSLAPAQVDSLAESPISVMPDGLLNGLRPQEVRDLFGYLQSALK
jgi:putative heme-binding domain-containing protein